MAESLAQSDAWIHKTLWRLADPLRPAELEPIRGTPPLTVRRLLTMARVHRVLGLVMEKLRPLAGEYSEVWETAARCHRGEVVTAMRIREHGELLLREFRARGIPVALIKGMDFADALYPVPRLRPTLDVDLLVPLECWPDAVKTLMTTKHTEKNPQPPFQLPSGILGERTWIHGRDPQIEVDLHWNLINLPSFRPAVSLQFGDVAWAKMGSQASHLPSRASRLAIAAVHATYHHQFDRLLLLTDLLQACRPLNQADIAELRQLTEHTGIGIALDLGLRIADRFLEVPGPKIRAECFLIPQFDREFQSHFQNP